MTKLLFKLLLVITLLLNTFSILSQKKKSNFEIQIYGIPFYKLSNHFYENRMMMKSDFFKLDYSEEINQEVGLNLKYKYKTWKFGLGASYNTFDFAHSFYFIDEGNYSWSKLSYHFERELKIRTIGIGIIGERKLTESISLGMRFSFNGIFQNELNTTPIESLELNNTSFRLKERHISNNTRLLLIPEFFLSKNIYKGLELLIGFKLKFYNKPFGRGSEFYSLEVEENSVVSNTVFSYKIDTYQTGFFFGASYTFQLPKLRKKKLD
tara:strand:+ start:86 stop:883 length:798 start_codon:yes stop_codon:yes gene_type:complete